MSIACGVTGDHAPHQAGIEEQREAEQAVSESAETANDDHHMMSHAGVTGPESRAWSAAVGASATAATATAAEDQVDAQDWAALQDHLGQEGSSSSLCQPCIEGEHDER